MLRLEERSRLDLELSGLGEAQAGQHRGRREASTPDVEFLRCEPHDGLYRRAFGRGVIAPWLGNAAKQSDRIGMDPFQLDANAIAQLRELLAAIQDVSNGDARQGVIDVVVAAHQREVGSAPSTTTPKGRHLSLRLPKTASAEMRRGDVT